jgi:16S rRNA (adenine1518-N6/adenine1519-N6)-dimethyltransferase
LIELDNKFSEYWKNQGLTVLNQDALQMDWQQLIHKQPSTALVSNLPYQISSSIVIDRSVDQHQLSGMVLMFQKEVAQRIRALPRTENYGMLSVIAQTFWNVSTVTEAGPRDFSPPPRVASRVLQFLPKACPIEDRIAFLKIIKACFAQRRKLMKSNLSSMLNQYHRQESQLVAWLEQRGHPATARAEELSITNFIDLFHFFTETSETPSTHDPRSYILRLTLGPRRSI